MRLNLMPGLWRDTVLSGIFASVLIPSRIRWRLYKAYGLSVERSNISPHVFIGSKRLSIGEGTFINRDCFFSTYAPITIGRDVSIAMRVVVSTSTHEIGPSSRRAGQLQNEPVGIGDGCWIGANVTILPGVTIGAGCIIAAGATVTADCEPNSLYGGVPARKIRAFAEPE